MKFIETPVKGAWLVELDRISDDRGFFARSWCQRELQQKGLNSELVQINVGYNVRKGTLRGMHYQRAPEAEVKLVRCTMGAVYDVVVDLRPDSPTHRCWAAYELTAENRRQLYIPEGCAHGYQTLVDDAEITYLTSRFYAPKHANGVRFDDPAFGVDWPLPVTSISDADKGWLDYEA